MNAKTSISKIGSQRFDFSFTQRNDTPSGGTDKMSVHIVLSDMERPVEILFEDETLLAINKAAGLVCHPTKGDAYSSVIGRLRLYFRDGTQPHFVNRLDRETSGVLLVAKNRHVAGELCKIWERRSVRKEYLAIVKGHVRASRGVINAPLGRDEQSRVAIKDTVRDDGAPASTTFKVVRRFLREEGEFSLLAVRPLTGRKHQIRIHLAYHGHPIVGDKIYGGDEELYLAFVRGELSDSQRQKLILANHALHAHAASFHWRGRDFLFRAEPEPWCLDFTLGDVEKPAAPFCL